MINMANEVFLVGRDETIQLKKALARILYDKCFDQSDISKMLNLSQPQVSNYCKSTDKIPKNIIDIAQEVSNKILKGDALNFQTCVSFSEKTIDGHFFLADKNEILTDENSKILDNLKQAFFNISDKNLDDFIPEVKINIAMSKNMPKGPGDVASFLNGLIIVDDKITGYNSIRFGRSKHLSSILLKHKSNIDFNAIMNIAYVTELEKAKLSVGFLTKDFEIKGSKKNYDLLIHKGDFGIEPCAYILGKDAVDVTDKLLKIVGEKN